MEEDAGIHPHGIIHIVDLLTSRFARVDRLGHLMSMTLVVPAVGRRPVPLFSFPSFPFI